MAELEAFNKIYIDRLKMFVDNDIKIWKAFTMTKEIFANSEALDAINRLEENYLKKLETCMSSYTMFNDSHIVMLQDEMLRKSLNVDDKIKIISQTIDKVNGLFF